MTLNKPYEIIKSGSDGNAIIYHNEILVDLGVAYKMIELRLSSIKYLLLTHIHKDHFNIDAIITLSVQYPDIKIFGNDEVIDRLKRVGVKNAYSIESNKWVELNGYAIASFDLQHNVKNVGWRIYKDIYIDGEYSRTYKIFHATDMGHLNDVRAVNYDLYMLENNYCEEKIQEIIDEKIAEGVYSYEIRVLADHFSNQQALKWLGENNINGVVVWLHISKQNNSDKKVEMEKIK